MNHDFQSISYWFIIVFSNIIKCCKNIINLNNDDGFFHNWKVKLLVTQSFWTLRDPMECSPPGSSVYGSFQARILVWFAIPFSRRSSHPRDRTCVSCIGKQILYCWATREAMFVYPSSMAVFSSLEELSSCKWKHTAHRIK